jgi:multiple sugar transport system substrate-binding protein
MKSLRTLFITGAFLAVTAFSVSAAPFTKPLTLMHDKGGEVGWTARLEEMSKAYAAKTGNAGIAPTEYPSTDAFMTALRASLSTTEPSPLFTWWAGHRLDEFVGDGLVANVSSLWDKHQSEYSAGLRKAYVVGRGTYAIPAGIAYWVMFYNTSVFAANNLKPPETWDQFLKVCATLKANGVVPMAESVQGAWPPMVQFMEFLVRTDPDFYESLMDGKARYTDPQVVEMFKTWRKLIDAGYFSDTATDLFADFPKLFAAGKIAMIDMGTWYTSVLSAAGVKLGQDYDFFLIPSINPKAGKVVIYEATPILISEKSAGKQAALAFADWWMSPEAQAQWGKLIGQFPSNAKSDMSFLEEPFQRLVGKINSGKYRQVNRFWEATLPDIASDALAQFGEFVLHPDNVGAVMTTLQANADKYWAKARK